VPDKSAFSVQPLAATTTGAAGLCVTDGAGTVLRATESFCRLHGRGERDLIGHPISVLAEAGGGPAFSAGYIDLLCGQLDKGAELRFPVPGQPALQMVARARTMAGMAGGRFTITTVTIQDSRQPERPDGLIGDDPGFAILAMIGDGIVGCDRHGVIDAFDQGAERLFGYAAAEVIGANVSMLMPDPYRAHHDRYMAEAGQAGGRPASASASCPACAGTARPSRCCCWSTSGRAAASGASSRCCSTTATTR